MCDEHTEADNAVYLKAQSEALSRRGFAALTGVAGVATLAACATDAGAQQAATAGAKPALAESDVKITTPDGVCDAYFVHPAKGKHAAVLVWPDIMGLRPAFRQMGRRLAEEGYAVLTINPFYRSQPSPVIKEGEGFQQPEVRARLMPLARSLSPETNVTDANAFVAWLDKQAAVDTRRKIGTTGYCMGGPMVMRTAAALPNRIGAGGSFHGGGLATAQPNSPHLLVPKMKASFLIAIADNDDKQDPNAKVLLREAFDAAKLPAEIEVYTGAMHGWVPPDSAVYEQASAEKAWARKLALFKTALS
jgi:carboxymethylenebutenolidase